MDPTASKTTDTMEADEAGLFTNKVCRPGLGIRLICEHRELVVKRITRQQALQDQIPNGS